MKTKTILPTLFVLLIWGFYTPAVFGHEDAYQKPEVCLTTNIRCILKKTGQAKYWCLKSNQQRNIDTRRRTSPIKKTPRANLGNCAKIIRIEE